MDTEAEIVSKIWRKGTFDGKVVFCTGGSGGICSAQVRALVYLGANACIVGRDQGKAERVGRWIAASRPGSEVVALGNMDVRRFEHVEKAVSTCIEKLGRIDFVIAGAAGNFLAPFLQLTPNAFRTVVDIDLIGSWNTAKATMPHLLKSAEENRGSGGRIIFISSTMGYVGTQLVSHAASAKAGIEALSNHLAIEVGPRGVSSNVLSPGPVEGTEGTKRLLGGDRAKTIPLGRLGSLKDMSDSVVYLFSDAASYVNGATLIVDGGAWRTAGQTEAGLAYPDVVLSDKSLRARTDNTKL